MGTVTSCGESPCGIFDALWTSSDCGAWNACQAALNAQQGIPLDQQINALPVGNAGSNALLENTTLQSALDEFEQSLEPVASSGFAVIQNYLPWIVGGFVAIAVLPSLLGGRRR